MIRVLTVPDSKPRSAGVTEGENAQRRAAVEAMIERFFARAKRRAFNAGEFSS